MSCPIVEDGRPLALQSTLPATNLLQGQVLSTRAHHANAVLMLSGTACAMLLLPTPCAMSRACASHACAFTTWIGRRQNILLSSFLSPEMNALVGGPLCANHAGRLKVRHEDQGVLARVVPQVRIVHVKINIKIFLIALCVKIRACSRVSCLRYR